MSRIGIMAGSGQFPFLVARGAKKLGLKVVICGFHGNTDPALEAEADAFSLLGLGQFGALIDFFKSHGVKRACMAGAICKPDAMNFRPDWRAAKLLFRLASNRGDDAILRAVAGELATEGIEVLPPDSLVPELRSPEGVAGKRRPTAEEWADIRFGWHIVKALGKLDIGQCVAVRGGVVVAVEGIEGTDAMLARAGQLGGAGCVAVKAAKPGQDERLDLPSLGAGTLETLASHRYSCLAFEAGKTLLFDRKAAIRLANEHGIALVGIPPDAEEFFEQMEREG